MKTGANIAVIEEAPRLSLEAVALEMAVNTLEMLGGDIDSLTEKFDAPHHLVLFHLEKRLRDHHNPYLRERWEKAIELFHSCRMRSLQREAIRNLEELDAGDDKVSKIHLAFAKLVLGDLFTGANVAARRRASTKDEASTVLAEGIAAMESPEIDDGESS